MKADSDLDALTDEELLELHQKTASKIHERRGGEVEEFKKTPECKEAVAEFKALEKEYYKLLNSAAAKNGGKLIFSLTFKYENINFADIVDNGVFTEADDLFQCECMPKLETKGIPEFEARQIMDMAKRTFAEACDVVGVLDQENHQKIKDFRKKLSKFITKSKSAKKLAKLGISWEEIL